MSNHRITQIVSCFLLRFSSRFFCFYFQQSSFITSCLLRWVANSLTIYSKKLTTFQQLRLLIYCLSYMLMKIQFEILTFPFYKYLLWLCGYADSTNLTVKLISSRSTDGVELCEYDLTLNSCFPWKKSPFTISSEIQLTQPLHISTFASLLIRGEMMAFLPNI